MKRLSKIYMILVFAFLYAPIVIMMFFVVIVIHCPIRATNYFCSRQ